jgi:hypothetical protein
MKSESASSTGNTPGERPPWFPYQNQYHKEHSERAMAEISNRPLRSQKEAYAQYDRLKAAAEKAGRRSARRSTVQSKETKNENAVKSPGGNVNVFDPVAYQTGIKD